jgi:hypothetical protein
MLNSELVWNFLAGYQHSPPSCVIRFYFTEFISSRTKEHGLGLISSNTFYTCKASWSTSSRPHLGCSINGIATKRMHHTIWLVHGRVVGKAIFYEYCLSLTCYWSGTVTQPPGNYNTPVLDPVPSEGFRDPPYARVRSSHKPNMGISFTPVGVIGMVWRFGLSWALKWS